MDLNLKAIIKKQTGLTKDLLLGIRIKPNDPADYDQFVDFYTKKELRPEDAGFDLYFMKDQVVHTLKTNKYRSQLIGFGFSCEVYNIETNTPVDYFLVPRSSMASKTPLRQSNSVGVIDSGYRGHLQVPVDNLDPEDVWKVSKGDRLFQIVGPTLSSFCKVEILKQDQELSSSQRGEGGFGSTG